MPPGGFPLSVPSLPARLPVLKPDGEGLPQIDVYKRQAFYGLIPGGVSVLDDTDSDIQVPNDINSFLWGQYVVPTEGGVWQKSNWQNIRNINYFMTHYQSVQAAEADVNIYVAEMRFFRAL